MRTRQPASVTAQKVTFHASACLHRLFEISLADDQNEIVLFSFHEGGRILKPRFGCNDVSAAASTNAKKVTFSPSACFLCSNQRMISRISEIAVPMPLWQGFCLSWQNLFRRRPQSAAGGGCGRLPAAAVAAAVGGGRSETGSSPLQ